MNILETTGQSYVGNQKADEKISYTWKGYFFKLFDLQEGRVETIKNYDPKRYSNHIFGHQSSPTKNNHKKIRRNGDGKTVTVKQTR